MFGNLFNQKTQIVNQSSTGQIPVNQTVTQTPLNSPLPNQPQNQVAEGAVIGSSMQPSTRQDLSVLTHLDTRTTAVLNQAEQETKRIKQQYIEPEQLLLGLLFDGEIFQLLTSLSLDVAKIATELQNQTKMGNFSTQPTLSGNTKNILDQAYTNAKNRSVDFISPEDLLLTLYSSSSVSNFLQTKGVKKEQIEEKLAKSAGFTTGKKSVLDKYGIDLTEQARAGKLDPVVGRDKEIERLVHILLRRSKNNPIIIGDAGVGKTAIVEGLAEEIAEGKAPKDLLQKKLFQLDITSLIAGASHRGEFEERLRDVIKEVQASNNQIILFIDEIHTLIGTGGESEGALDASNIIKPFLARGQLQMIGATTTAEYRRHFEKDKAFERRFQPILVEEPTEEVACEMLNILKPKYENFHKVVIPPETIKEAVHLSKRYIGERNLPDKAVDLMDEAAAEVRLKQSEGKRQDNNVTKSDIEKIVSSWTGIPITKLTEDESEKLLHLEDFIHKSLIDQERAVSAVSEAVRRGRIGLTNANRPIASFIFLGPTGVGKTELAKTLAEILFGKKEATIRLDMSEYMEKHEVAKLIGAPPGYVGYEEGGQLTEAVRKKPYSIVLLDEIEKAHPDVFNILLQILEDGRLTDNKGNTISFKNTIIIATSNIGSTLIQQLLQQQAETPTQEGTPDKKFAELSKVLIDELHKFFKPELLNRFDEVVVFEPLAKEDMLAIAKLAIENTRKLLLEQNIDITISQKALEDLAKDGYDPVYGARPLRRLVQTAIENPIALLLIQKNFVAGDVVAIDYDESKDQFTFNKGVKQQTPEQSQKTQEQNQTVQQETEVPPQEQNINQQEPQVEQPQFLNNNQQVTELGQNPYQPAPSAGQAFPQEEASNTTGSV